MEKILQKRLSLQFQCSTTSSVCFHGHLFAREAEPHFAGLLQKLEPRRPAGVVLCNSCVFTLCDPSSVECSHFPEIKAVRNASPLVLKTQGLWEVRGNGAGNVSGNCETKHVLDLHCLSREISLFFFVFILFFYMM